MGVKGKLYRLTYLLNKDTEISVKTAVGATEFVKVGENVGQGTNEGAVISAASLDGGISEAFEDSNNEVECDGNKMGPCLFQDDVLRLAENLNSIREGNLRMERMAKSKLLDFNHDKLCLIMIGTRKFKKKIMSKREVNPIMFCNKTKVINQCEKYLGDYIGSSLSESVFTTIQKRKGLTLRLISEIKFTIQDCRSQVIGGLLVGLEIWRMAVVPFLFGNCETWTETPKKATNLLNFIQNTFFRSLFSTCNGCPIPIFYWDTATLLPQNYLILQKLLFLHHLCKLPEESLAKEIYVSQKENNFPGLTRECDKYLVELDITNDPADLTKKKWKNLIKDRIHRKNKSDLLDQIKSYKKLNHDEIKEEEYGMKDYLKTMNMSEARTYFAIRSKTVRTVQMNFKNKKEYLKNNWK